MHFSPSCAATRRTPGRPAPVHSADADRPRDRGGRRAGIPRPREPCRRMNRLARLLEGRTRFGLVAGALMWIVWAIGSVAGPGNLDLNGQVIGTDHSAFHTAAVLIAEGRGEALFQYPELTEFRARQEELVGKTGFLDPYRNPPFYALLYLPTAGFPISARMASGRSSGSARWSRGCGWCGAGTLACRWRGRSASIRCSPRPALVKTHFSVSARSRSSIAVLSPTAAFSPECRPASCCTSRSYSSGSESGGCSVRPATGRVWWDSV